MRYSKVLIPLAIVSSLCSFAFAQEDASSAQSLKKAKNCISGSYGLGNGDGYAGYCCKSQSDCWDDCRNGLCTGESAPNKTKTKSSTKSSTKTKTKTNDPAPTNCLSGSYGKKNGDGYKGFCCKSQADCQDDCIKGVCNGDSAPNKTKTNTKTSTKTKTNGPAPTNCLSGSYGKKNGDGYKGYCCKSQADCQDDCVKGVCNGDSAPNKTKTKSSTKTKTNGPAPTNCKSGYRGKGRGNGPKNACCSSQADCIEDCVKSKCT